MPEKPTYEELEQRILELERTLAGQTTARNLPLGKAPEENEGKYGLMVENANEAILVAQDGVFVFSNPRGEALFGYSVKELGSRPLTEFVHEADRRMVGERHEGRLGGDPSIPDVYPFRIIHKSGDIRWVNLKVALFSWENRPATLCFMADITERKRAEEKLRENEARYHAILRNQYVVMMVIDPDTGAIRDANPAAVAFYGWSYKALTGMNIKAINTLPPAEVEKQMRAARQKHRDFFHFQHRLKDGTVRDVEVSSGPVSYGEKMLLYSIVRDVTRRERAEEALKESEARYRAIFDQTAVGITVISPDGHILEANETMCAMLGYTPEELTGLTISDINWPEDMVRQRPLIQAVLDGKRDKFQLEKRYLRKDGQPVWVYHSSNVVRKENGVIEYAIGASTDITDRKHAEAALQKSLAEKEVLLREIHHRVKNNMQIILGLLRMHARRTDDVHLTEVFNDCRDRIGAMSLIHEALYQSENLAKIDFEAYLKKLCRNLAQAHDARRKGITLTASAADVSLDMDQGVAVGMVIAELISNSFKHAFPDGEGGAVSVHLDRPDGETVRLVVSDTGIGLPKDFDIRNPPSLGMRLVAGAVTRELGGTLAVERDEGTRFMIRFPCDAR